LRGDHRDRGLAVLGAPHARLRRLAEIGLAQRLLGIDDRVEEQPRAAEGAEVRDVLRAATPPDRADHEPFSAGHQRALPELRARRRSATMCARRRAMGGRIETSPRSHLATELLVTPIASASSTCV
jgi:hypothetical protein